MFSVISAAVLNGQTTLVGWDFSTLTGGTNNFGISPLSASSISANITTTGLVRGSGIGTSGSGAGNAWGGVNVNEASASAAITAGDFVTFTIDPAAGFTMSLSSIAAYNIRRSGTGATSGLWQYSTNGTTFSDIGSVITWGSTTTSAGNAQSSIGLSSISALQNTLNTVTIRLVVFGASQSGGTWYLNDPLDTVALDLSAVGTLSAIPEPSAYSAILGGFVLAGSIGLRRRRRV